MPVLILTARDRWSDKVAGFDAGADDYLAKPFITEELLARLRALMRRAAGIATADIEIGPLRIDTRASRVTLDGNPVKLTSLEYRLLAYLAHHRGKVVSRTELVEHLYDQDFDRDSNTIEVFVGQLAQETGRRADPNGARLGYGLEDPALGAPQTSSCLIPCRAPDRGGGDLDHAGPGAGRLCAVGRFRKRRLGQFRRRAQRRHGRADRSRSARPRWRRGAAATVSSIISSTGSIPGFISRSRRPSQAKPERQISPSLFDREIAIPAMTADQASHLGLRQPGRTINNCGTLSRRLEFPIASTPDQHDSRVYTVTVAGDLAEVDAESTAFNGTLIWSFLLLVLGLVTAIFLQVRVGLLPLRKLKESLARIRDGKAQRLEGNFPAEIAPLARANSIPTLIEHSAEVIGRARTHVSNLAHFLKTPLSVLASEARGRTPRNGSIPWPSRLSVRSASCAAKSIIIWRAPVPPAASMCWATAPRSLRCWPSWRGCWGGFTPTAPSRSRSNVLPGLNFRGERQDLEEMAGNLIDNACKWAHAKCGCGSEADGAMLVITVDDDGARPDPGRAGPGSEHAGERLGRKRPRLGAWAWPSSRIFPSFMRVFCSGEAPNSVASRPA